MKRKHNFLSKKEKLKFFLVFFAKFWLILNIYILNQFNIIINMKFAITFLY